jgi:hypothetical protein
LVRDELTSLLEANPPYGRTPEPAQVVTFEAEWERTGHGAKACDATTADFMLDIAGTPRSLWNISAARVFTSYLIEKMGYDDTEEMRKAIEKVFSTRVKSLKSRQKRDALPQAEKAAAKSKYSRHQRKYQVIVVSVLRVLKVTYLWSSCFIVVAALQSSMDLLRSTWRFWTH